MKRCSYLSFYEIIKKSAECTDEREQERKRMGLEVGNRSRGDKRERERYNVSRSILLQYVSARHAELTDWLAERYVCLAWEMESFSVLHSFLYLWHRVYLLLVSRLLSGFFFFFFVQTSGAFFFPVCLWVIIHLLLIVINHLFLSSNIKIRISVWSSSAILFPPSK